MKMLERIDKYFYEKSSKKEFVYLLILLVLAIGFVIYYYIYPIAKNYQLKSKEEYLNTLTLLQQQKVQLNVLKVKKIQLQKQLQTLSKKLSELRKEKIFFDELTNLLDFAEFNQVKWAQFVKNVIMDAKAEGLKVKSVENKIFDEKEKLKKLPSGMIVKKMSIGLELNGNYINFIHFIYKYEDRKDLIRVEKMKVKDRNDYYVEFTLYGYEK